jgi:hypothetical protein
LVPIKTPKSGSAERSLFGSGSPLLSAILQWQPSLVWSSLLFWVSEGAR